MDTPNIAEYAPALDVGRDTFESMVAVAELTGGTLAVTAAGRLVIYDVYNAREAAGLLEAADFPFGYVVPGTDTTLVFEF